MRIAITTVTVPFVRGGAELSAENLKRALIMAGHDVEVISIPFKWYPPERILDHLLACRLMDLTEASGRRIDLLIGLKFPAFHIPHENKVLWIFHQHRQAYDLWDDPEQSDLRLYPNGSQVCSAIRHADKTLFSEAKHIYTISRTVSDRLQRFLNIPAGSVYQPPPNPEIFYSDTAQDYLFFPSRITRLKRQKLAIEALAKTRTPVRIRFAGTPEYLPDLDELRSLCADLDLVHRVEWLGAITETEKADQYAHCLAVIYPPLDEDYGYVTLEAMIAAKPVITCHDSGGPNEFVVNNQTGVITSSTPDAIAEAIDALWEDRYHAQRMGEAGAAHYRGMGISWENVVRTLLS